VAWQNARNYFYDLICVQTIKMEMARHYLTANGHHCAGKASIDEMAAGCAWVDQHLVEAQVNIRREVAPSERPSMNFSKRTRFVYTAENISTYANGLQFRTVLDQIRRVSLMRQLQSLGPEEREHLFAALSTSQSKQQN
jgi:hypothetical protein